MKLESENGRSIAGFQGGVGQSKVFRELCPYMHRVTVNQVLLGWIPVIYVGIQSFHGMLARRKLVSADSSGRAAANLVTSHLRTSCRSTVYGFNSSATIRPFVWQNSDHSEWSRMYFSFPDSANILRLVKIRAGFRRSVQVYEYPWNSREVLQKDL